MKEQHGGLKGESDDNASQPNMSPRRPYEAPKLVSGDVFERVVLASSSLPNQATCSDSRLKTDIVPQDSSRYEHLGLQEYTWTWNTTAFELYGLEGSSFGVLAQEVEAVVPEAVVHDEHGYRKVAYGLLEAA